MIYLMIFICIINIILWIVFLARFKKLFSTDSIIENTREELNLLLKDLDRAADRDIQLAEESSKRLKAAVEDAEKKMDLFIEASNRLKGMISEADKINKISNQNNSLFQDFNKISQKKTVQKKQVNSYIKNSTSKKTTSVDPEAVYEVSKSNQGDLFGNIDDSVILNLNNQETKVTEDGAAFKEVPLIITKVLDDEKVAAKTAVEEKQLSLEKKVNNLFNEGFSVEEIASKLSCSITEVQFIIDMNN